MNLIVFSLIMLSVVFNTAAQLALKAGISAIGTFSFTFANIIPISLKIISSPWIIIGMAIYVGSVTVWLMVLSRAPVSMAFPMSSLAYVTSAIAAYYLLGEDLSLVRIAGIIVIMIGVFLVAKS
jgi:drug/metabolite transporter (DMT)-like permease